MATDKPSRWENRLSEAGSSSFFEFVQQTNPAALPFGEGSRSQGSPEGRNVQPDVPHGTTIVALSIASGVIMAGDRRATMGNVIASRRIEKVFPADSFSVLGIAGTAGIAIDIVKLFQVELEHYEKIEGLPLSLDGKANRLGAMIRANLPQAMQGLSVVPLFAGVDAGQGTGRLFSYDVTGGRYEELEHHAVGSGAFFARGSLKKLWQPEMNILDGLSVAIESLFDAADDDSATGEPDLVRKLWPVVYTVTGDGVARVNDETLAEAVTQVIAKRTAAGREA